MNLDKDIAEVNNVARTHPDVVARFVQLHEAWLADVNQPRPQSEAIKSSRQ